MKIWCDLDGVLADFDAGYEALTGHRPGYDRVWDAAHWQYLQDFHPTIYRDLPPTPDMGELWDFIRPHQPTILTGAPRTILEAREHKREWVTRHLGADVEVVCCRSEDKCLRCRPGDILIDDWEMYRHKWLDAGGVWITHRSAAQTIAELRQMGVGP